MVPVGSTSFAEGVWWIRLMLGRVLIGGGDGVGEDDVGLAAELIEYFGEGEDGADGVPVGAGVRGEEEAGIGAKGRQ